MKMKMKNRIKVSLISVLLACMFISSFSANASGTRIDHITIPETVELGETFEINVSFNYPSTSDCLWSGSLIMYYGIGNPPEIDYYNPMTLIIEDYSTDNPSPSEALIEIDTSTLNCKVNDTFLFKIKYHTGRIVSDVIYESANIMSEYYQLTIVEATETNGTNETNISIAFFVAPLLFLSVIVLNKKNNQRGKRK